MKQHAFFSHFKGDCFGGVTAAVVALPLALAFGVQSGMGAIAGLYGAMTLGIIAAVLGGTATQVSGPTGPMTVISAMVIAAAIDKTGSLQAGMGMIIGTFILAGAFQIIFGFLNVGKYIKYLPYPVLSGFMTGIGVLIILYQIYPFFGHHSENSTITILMNLNVPLSAIHWSAVGLSLLTLAIIYLFPLITKAVPSTLVALLVATCFAVIMKLDVPTIGNIPSGFPKLLLSSLQSVPWPMLWTMLEFAITLAALGSIDSLLTCVIVDNITKTKHNSNRELIGQGLGNMGSAIIGGLPGAGATMRTIVNLNAGGRTRLSGLIHGLLLAAILLGLSQYAALIPLSVLAGILISVGIGIIDYKGLRHLRRVPKTDAAVLIIVLLITVFGNLLHAVGVGVILACVLFMKQAGDFADQGTSISSLKNFDDDEPWSDEDSVHKEYKNTIYIKHLYGSLFFGFTSRFQELVQSLDKRTKVLIIRMDKVPYMDQSGLYALEDCITELQNKDIPVLLTGIRPQPLDMLKKIDLIPALVPDIHVFDDFKACKKWLKHHLKDQKGDFSKIVAELHEVKKANVNINMMRL